MIFAKTKSKTRVLGLALGSGGARGLAHIGVLRALREADLEPDVIAGASAGAIVAAAYASGRLNALGEIAETLDWRLVAGLFIEFGIPRDGLVKGVRVMRFLRDIIPAENFNALRIPTAVVAADIDAEAEAVFTSGPLHHALRASIAIPGVFTPVPHNGRLLADGGLVNPVPVSAARALGATHVIAVDINTRRGSFPPVEKPVEPGGVEALLTPERLGALDRFIPATRMKNALENWRAQRRAATPAPRPANLFAVLTRSFRLYENTITRVLLGHSPPDLLVAPAVGHVPTLDFTLARACMDEGRDAMFKALDGGGSIPPPSG